MTETPHNSNSSDGEAGDASATAEHSAEDVSGETNSHRNQAGVTPGDGRTTTGFTKVAKLISRRTTDVLATAIIGFGVFAVGGRLSDWWNTTPEQMADPQSVALDVAGRQLNFDDSQAPVHLQLGLLPVELRRATIQGSQDELEKFLLPQLEKLVSTTEAADWPRGPASLRAGGKGDSLGQNQSEQHRNKTSIERRDETLVKIETAERRLLLGIREIQPLKTLEDEGREIGRLYRIDQSGTFSFASTFVGTRRSSRGDRRVVAWAIAIPYRSRDWRVFWFRRIAKQTNSLQSFPLPSDAELIISLGKAGGNSLISFCRRKDAKKKVDWQEFFVRRFESAGWIAASRFGIGKQNAGDSKVARSKRQVTQWTKSGQLVSTRLWNPQTNVSVEITLNPDAGTGIVNVIVPDGK